MVYSKDAQRQLFCNIVDALKLNTEIWGLITTSWWYDPQLVRINPHMVFLKEEMENGGAYVLKYKRQAGHALANSSARQALFEQGQYQPCSYTIIWPRDRMIEWAGR